MSEVFYSLEDSSVRNRNTDWNLGPDNSSRERGAKGFT